MIQVLRGFTVCLWISTSDLFKDCSTFCTTLKIKAFPSEHAEHLANKHIVTFEKT
jgi:hypothetical protein